MLIGQFLSLVVQGLQSVVRSPGHTGCSFSWAHAFPSCFSVWHVLQECPSRVSSIARSVGQWTPRVSLFVYIQVQYFPSKSKCSVRMAGSTEVHSINHTLVPVLPAVSPFGVTPPVPLYLVLLNCCSVYNVIILGLPQNIPNTSFSKRFHSNFYKGQPH